MVKLGRKNKQTDNRAADRGAQGITGRGNAMLSAVALGAAIAVLPAFLAAAYLFLIRAPAQQEALLERVGASYAAQQARHVQDVMLNLRQRLQSAARSPLALQAVAEDNPEDLRLVEQALLDYFPEAVSLRLLPLGDLGTADLESGLGLRNHIEVDLVRRVANAVLAEPEAYQFEGEWLVSMAQVATHPQLKQRRSVVLVTLGLEQLRDMLRYPGDMPGEFSLLQRFVGEQTTRDITITQVGTGVDRGRQRAAVVDTPWQVVFRPSQALISSVTANVRPDYDIIGLLALLAIAGFALAWRRLCAALEREIQRIETAAEHRTPLQVQIPQLVPVAKELRKLTLRRTRSTPGAAAAGAPAASTPGNVALTSVEGPATGGLAPHIFRAYDIRGVADTELDDETVYRIGSAIGTIAGEMGEQTLVIGYDGRASSSRIKAVLEKALLQAGRDVIDIGLVPTPLLYFATHHLDAGSGVMVTGSHNPPQYNGMKIVLKRQSIAHGTIEKIRNIAHTGRFSKGTGHLIQKDVVSDYLDEVVSDIAIAVPLRIVVDASNGAGGPVAPALLEELGCEVLPINCDVDGRFPGHPPDTGNEDNLKALVAEVISAKADFGVAYDGDADRLAVVTGSGEILRTDRLMMLFARDVVSRNPGADVIYDVKCSRQLAQLVTSLGGRPVLWKTGHALMKQKMAETGALLGGEFSGHVFFGERWFGFDDGMYATGRLAEILSSEENSLDELVAKLPSAVSTPEIIIPISDDEKFKVMERFIAAANFPDGKAQRPRRPAR
jgi:phosphomannomutase/phosphoglucomutase